MATVKSLAKSLGILAALYLFCRYLGDFSSKQSAVLTLLGWLGNGLYERLNALQRSDKAFSPFSVSIYPNWYRLLSDFKLVGSKEEWYRLSEAMGKLPATEYNVCRNGIVFTVVAAPSADSLLPGLTYSDNHKSFVSEVEFSESIAGYVEDMRSEHEPPFFKHPRWGNLPEVYFKSGSGGYELGLEVQDDWWEQVCKTGEIGELAKTKSDRNHLCGTTRLLVATLPYSEFDVYYGANDYDSRKVQQEAARGKQLEANGWKPKVERDMEIRDPWRRIDHKYFAVAHRGI